MHSVNNAENAPKPQNLRVLLLKSKILLLLIYFDPFYISQIHLCILDLMRNIQFLSITCDIKRVSSVIVFGGPVN